MVVRACRIPTRMVRDGRCVVELTALAGGRVGGEHRHPLSIERFTVLEGELRVQRDAQTLVLVQRHPGG